MLLFQERRIQSNVWLLLLLGASYWLSTDINSELDELDREEFYRLKKVSGKKQRDQAAADEEIKKKREQQNGKKKTDESDEDEQEATDVLGEHEDDDVIF